MSGVAPSSARPSAPPPSSRAASQRGYDRADPLIEQSRLIVCVGPGGVGKTSVAATLALEAARRGKRALVLTIDPARRLATALGLDGLDDSVRQVETAALTRWGARVEGQLFAAMLDTRASYDALIRRLNGDARAAQRILDNRVYQAFSRTLARSHAYVAMERLYDVTSQGEYDLVVLDTPPTRSALDILDAPGRLVRFLDDDVVRWFTKPRLGGRLSRLLPTGSAAATRLLGLLASQQLVEELISFFSVLLHLREGFRERAAAVQELLRAEETAFCLVCSPSRTSLWDAAYLREGLVSRGVRLSATVFNRAYVPSGDDSATPLAWAPPVEPRERLSALGLTALKGAAVHKSAAVPRPSEAALVLLSELSHLRQDAAAYNHAAQAAMERFQERLPPGSLRVRLPELSDDPRDLIDLLHLSRALFTPG
ncbi:MAG: ArsA family ATPase [Polyangiaceae bacterium]|nr:ArsA family ATPase [Polyangiaceae bacterium]